MYMHVHMYVHGLINEPQLLGCTYHMGLNVKISITKCAGRVSAYTFISCTGVTGSASHAHVTLMTGVS